MIRLVVMLKKKAGMADADFREHYENVHAPIGLSLMPEAVRYHRSFLKSLGSKATPFVSDAFDVITEVWYKDQESLDRTLLMRHSENGEKLTEDEFNLFDREATRYYIIDDERISSIESS